MSVQSPPFVPSKCVIVAFIWPLHIFMGCWTSFLGRTPWNLDYWDRIVGAYTRKGGPHNTGLRTQRPLAKWSFVLSLSRMLFNVTRFARGEGEKFSSSPPPPRVGEFANKTNAVKIWPCNIRLCLNLDHYIVVFVSFSFVFNACRRLYTD